MITPANLGYAADGTPYSATYDDVYHSTDGGLDQARYVFLGGNQLPSRWQQRERFTILETGFGLGLNFLTTWQAWRNDDEHCQRLHFISTELHPFRRDDLAALHQRWPELAELSAELLANWPPLTPGFHHLTLDQGRVTLTLLFGDASNTLPELVGQADCIYLDGFGPRKNPQLWSAELLSIITEHARAEATLASWCVAGDVKNALRELGWQLRKRPGFAQKWQMLCGTFSPEANASTKAPVARSAIVIGAGIAGCSAAEALTRRGWHVTLVDQHAAPAQEASGNPAGLLHPMLARDDNVAARFSRAAHLYSLRLLRRLGTCDATLSWASCGILQAAENEVEAEAQRETCARLGFPPAYVSWLSQETASAHVGMPLAAGGWWFPQGAWVNPAEFCRSLLHQCGDALRSLFSMRIERVAYRDGEWHVFDKSGHSIAQATHLVLANAAAASALLPDLTLTLRAIRGQISYLPNDEFDNLQTALCGAAYVIKPNTGPIIIGASFVEDDSGSELRDAEHEDNLQCLRQLLPSVHTTQTIGGRVAFRAATHDRMPLIGRLPAATLKPSDTLAKLARQPGLFALLGLGSRGLSWGPLGAEVLAAQMSNEAMPVEKALLKMLDPARYQLRHARREE